MQPPAEHVRRRAPLLTIRTASGAWGIPSSAVASVEQPGEAAAAGALSLWTLLGIDTPVASAGQARVVVLAVAGERLPLLVHGALTLVETAVGDLLPLPAAVQTLTPLVSHLAVV